MYDGTIVPLHAKPAVNDEAYFTCKSNYGLNVQINLIVSYIGNLPSNLCIVDYSHGMMGSAHDAWAFEHTAAVKYPDWFFQGQGFEWANSAYEVSPWTIPVHEKPAAFDYAVANIPVCSEHCMGALKGQFRCL
ncbi:hypothetical protein PAXRUDRAFT_781362 [Paxillus rubicundulus Ve08.2h10]|uniref:DDE Tnp4 domain-containing protein n=1 Tax=Paxillus rubicundulus Ve08.2h10 TaxID=930991 RepID=A0A0D0DQM8_9AGAM|nr:hypothetical protein PAXRUDRAFT_781362 [Paxillus rubicundulus Ve08.2h10]